MKAENPTAHSVITGALYNSIVRRTGRVIGFGEADKIAGDIMASLVYADFKVLDDDIVTNPLQGKFGRLIRFTP